MPLNFANSVYQDLHADDGYRPNIGIILSNQHGKVLWARRAGRDGWQFPQGGVKRSESIEQALFRELYEELGLQNHHVRVLAHTSTWLRYDLPRSYLRRVKRRGNRKFRGQKQIWCLLGMLGEDSEVCLFNSDRPEFDQWVWTDWTRAIDQIVHFKKQVYLSAWSELSPFYESYQERGWVR